MRSLSPTWISSEGSASMSPAPPPRATIGRAARRRTPLRAETTMNWILSIPLIALTVLQGPAVAQPLDPRTEADAYAVYASLNFKPGVILMRETEGPQYRACSDFISSLSGEWRQVAQDFRDKNSRTWLLQPGVLGFEYRLVSNAEILADNARVTKLYGGRPPQLAPERIQYVALSA